MKLRKRLRYLYDYYRWVFFLILIAGLILFYMGDLIRQSRQTVDLQGFFINDRQNLFPAKELTEDFSDYIKIPRGHRIAFEDSLFIDLDSSGQYETASQSKLTAYIAARELDFLVAPEELARYYARSFPLMDLNKLLPEDLKDRLEEDLVWDGEGNKAQMAWGLDLRHSRFLEGTDWDHKESYYLMILSYTPHWDARVSFLQYAYEKAPQP